MARDLYFEFPAASLKDLVAALKKHSLDEEARDASESVERYNSDTITIGVSERWTPLLVLDLLKVAGDKRSLRNTLRAYGRLLENPLGAPVKKLKLMPAVLASFLMQDTIDGWLYRKEEEDIFYAYVVTRIEYDPPSGTGMNFREAVCTVHLKTNRPTFGERASSEPHVKIIRFFDDDVSGNRNIIEVLLLKNLYHETPELKEEYEGYLELFSKYQPQEHKQFWGKGRFVRAKRNYDKGNEFKVPTACRVVNDEDLLERTHHPTCSRSYLFENAAKGQFEKIPFCPTILCFDLDRHENVWIHAADLKPYVYNPGLRDKLVLPAEHRDLIEILVEDLDIFMEDIVIGKSGGTAILCQGPAGTGKTLSAEVYSEHIKRPLYRVHAGQLGITSESIEQNLEEILKRAERWGAVLLLDEADVYIRKRTDDMEHNAVVAAFLRTLEYFHGLLFLTTNRGDDVDDAIASRMIAIFKYDKPIPSDAAKIWRILSNEFKMKVSDKLIKELLGIFPRISGRDIKGLLKLTAKYVKRKGVPLDADAFRIVGVFRGCL